MKVCDGASESAAGGWSKIVLQAPAHLGVGGVGDRHKLGEVGFQGVEAPVEAEEGTAGEHGVVLLLHLERDGLGGLRLVQVQRHEGAAQGVGQQGVRIDEVQLQEVAASRLLIPRIEQAGQGRRGIVDDVDDEAATCAWRQAAAQCDLGVCADLVHKAAVAEFFHVDVGAAGDGLDDAVVAQQFPAQALAEADLDARTGQPEGRVFVVGLDVFQVFHPGHAGQEAEALGVGRRIAVCTDQVDVDIVVPGGIGHDATHACAVAVIGADRAEGVLLRGCLGTGGVAGGHGAARDDLRGDAVGRAARRKGVLRGAVLREGRREAGWDDTFAFVRVVGQHVDHAVRAAEDGVGVGVTVERTDAELVELGLDGLRDVVGLVVKLGGGIVADVVGVIAARAVHAHLVEVVVAGGVVPVAHVAGAFDPTAHGFAERAVVTRGEEAAATVLEGAQVDQLSVAEAVGRIHRHVGIAGGVTLAGAEVDRDAEHIDHVIHGGREVGGVVKDKTLDAVADPGRADHHLGIRHVVAEVAECDVKISMPEAGGHEVFNESTQAKVALAEVEAAVGDDQEPDPAAAHQPRVMDAGVDEEFSAAVKTRLDFCLRFWKARVMLIFHEMLV